VTDDLVIVLAFAIGLVAWHGMLRLTGPITTWLLTPFGEYSRATEWLVGMIVVAFLVFSCFLLIRLVPWFLGFEASNTALTKRAILASFAGCLSLPALVAADRVVRRVRKR
jgi:hypothetical protein